MKKQVIGPAACGLAVMIAAAASSSAAPPVAAERELAPPPPVRYSGLLNDYTPSAAVVKGGPYEMRGKWTLEIDTRRGTATFTAAMNMETSDYGITQLNSLGQPTVNKDDPTTRAAHTHHISLTDGVVSDDWATSCPSFNPAVTGGFVVRGSAFVTGNGAPAPFGNPSPLTICVLGGANVKFSNVTLSFGLPANSHFGKQAIHGVILACDGPWWGRSPDCSVQE